MEKLMPIPHQDLDLLEAINETVLYFTTSISFSNFWDEACQIIVKFFNPDLICFITIQTNKDISAIDGNDSQICQELLGKTHDSIIQVFENDSLLSEVVNLKDSYSIAIYPISVKHNIVAVMVIGYKGREILPKKIINVYNAIARLVGSTYHSLTQD